MSWFNRLKNRLFNSENDQSEDLMDEQEQVEAYDENQYENIEKPIFRFPIVTDAEIYGWDEEIPTIEREYSDDNIEREEPDNFVPTPFYQNERWPNEDVPPVIHRAGVRPARHVAKEEQEPTVESDKINSDQSRLIKTKRSQRFSPTVVPSPIYGFSERKKKQVAAIEKETKFTLSSANEEIKEELASEVVKSDKDLVEYTDVKNNLSLTENQTDGVISVEEVVIEESVKDVVDEIEEVELEELEEIKEVEEVEVEEIKENITNLETNQVEAEAQSEQQILGTVTKKDRAIPFNVLMLKSDKAKLSKSAQQAPAQKEVNNRIREETLNTPKEKPIFYEEIIEEPSKEIQEDIQEETTELASYAFPTSQYLIPPEKQIEDTEWLESQSEKLEVSLSHFGVQANVIEAIQGPTVTRFELTVGQGTKVSRVRNLTDDLKLALAAKEIRIQAPIPGKSSIGIEIPNRQTRPVRISEVIATDEFLNSDSPLEAVLGLGLTGKPVTIDLREMPHGLIAGATGSGKSVCINSILVSLLYKASPSDLKMMLIDPKMVELAPFNGIPHLISPVITDVKAATAALKWAVGEMERRYELLAHTGVRDIERYNKVVTENRQYSLKMPYLLIVIDELSDLMMMSPADVEVSIIRIAQKARACGIHLIIATQRPSVDVITGTIKANIPTRIAFSVSSQVDSRTIIDTIGAERLLGKGDMLYLGNGQSSSVRLQGTFVTDDEIERIIEHVRNEAEPSYLFGQDELLKSAIEEEETDPLFEEACIFIYEQGSASTSLLQRNFSIGYNRAAKLMDRIEKHGFISEQRGSRARDVLITQSDIEQLTEPVL